MSAAAARIEPVARTVPRAWTLIAPGLGAPLAFASADELARTIVAQIPADGPVSLTRLVCTYPGFDTFPALKVEALTPGGDRHYLGVVAIDQDRAPELLAAIRRAAAE